MTLHDDTTAQRDRDLREQQQNYARMMVDPSAVFVFGSNREGIHGGGAAKTALTLYGAVWGQGEGPQGRAYALPTKVTTSKRLTVEEIRDHVATFLAYARMSPGTPFLVTRVGCGLAGHVEEDIAPLFAHAPPNCLLPENWR